MFGATSVAGVATFGVFYGFFSGGSKLSEVDPFNVSVNILPFYQWYHLLRLQ
jgi:hypothetical protein